MLLKYANTDRIEYDPSARFSEVLKRRKVLITTSTDEEEEKEESEKSYQPLFTTEEFFESLINLNFNLTWTFITILANLFLYTYFTYQIVFDHSAAYIFGLLFIQMGSNIIMILDAVAIISFHLLRDTSLRTAHHPISRWLVLMYLISLIAIPMEVILLFYYNLYLVFVTLAFLSLRFWKIAVYIALMNNLPGQITLFSLYKKYLVIWILVIHTLVCIWKLIGCYEEESICDAKFYGRFSYWSSVIYTKHNVSYGSFTPFKLYCVSLNYILGGLTSLGYEGASTNNPGEEAFLTFVMFLYIWLVYCLLNADFTMCIIHVKTFEGHMVYRLRTLENDLIKQHDVPHTIKKRILNYYREFFFRDKAIKHATLMHVVPDPFLNETKTEIFWNALLKCKVIRSTSEAFKQAVMRSMHMEAFSRGDILFDLGKSADEMCFVARGNLHVLSGEDGDSPILTLGKGSIIGQMNLLYTKVTKFKIVVATYSVIYILNKRYFWQTVNRYHKLQEGRKVHQNFQQSIELARKLREVGVQKTAISFVRKWKCLESKKILSEFKEKIKKQAQMNEHDLAIRREHSHNMYTYSEIHNQKSYDDIFLKTSWPWILRPHSQFLKMWNICVLITVLYVAIRYPYIAAFQHEKELNNALTAQTVFVVYVFDILIRAFTAIETKTETVWSVSDILSTRIESISFVLDIISSFPFHFYSLFVVNATEILRRFLTMLCLNRLLKLYKIDVLVREFEQTTKINISIVKTIKCGLYVTYLGYILSTLYYSLACFESQHCYEDSWVHHLRDNMVSRFFVDEETHSNEMLHMVVFKDILSVVTNTCPCISVSFLENMILSLFSVVGILVVNYLFAEYAAGLTLKHNSAIEFLEFYEATKRFMARTNMPKSLQTRVFRQLKTNWRMSEGIERKHLYQDCPERLFNTLQIAINEKHLASVPLFQGLEEEILDLIATRCFELYIPPKEFLVYSGELSRNMYVILNGTCVVMDGNVGKKMLGPGSFLNGMETILVHSNYWTLLTIISKSRSSGVGKKIAGLPSTTTICAITYVTALSLNYRAVKYIFAKFPQFEQTVRQSVDEEAIERVFHRISEYCEYYKYDEHEEPSFFIFPKHRRDPLNIDYRKVYYANSWKIARYVLLRRTIMPNGKFLRNWEIFKAITAFLLSLIIPPDWVYLHYFPNLIFFYYLLYSIGFLDMYFRLHVCYYNEKGILVTHPKYTAKNYLSHAFLLDFIATFPIAFVLTRLGNMEPTKTVLLLNSNVLLQMYRYPEIFSNMYDTIFIKTNALFQAARCLPFTLVIICLFSCLLMYVSSDTFRGEGNTIIMMRKNNSWIEMTEDINHLDTKEPYVFFITSLYLITGLFLGANFKQYQTNMEAEAVIVIITIVVGYVYKTFVTVGIVHSRYVVNQKLTRHRNNMVQLLNYLKEEGISKKLQAQVIEHYTQTWRISYGYHNKTIWSFFHLPLRTDFCLHTYLETLQKVPVFEEGTSRSFFRNIARHVSEMYLKKGQKVIKLNDVVKVIYIVHQGEVVIYAPTNKPICTLKQGSMFGNIDEIYCSRSMVSAETSKTTDLLVIGTTDFYNLLLGGYTILYKKMHHYLILHNLSYIKSSEENSKSDNDFDINVKESLLNTVFASNYYSVAIVLAAVGSCFLSSYQLAFNTETNALYYILYCLDVIHVAQIILNFYVPYEDDRGDLVTDLGLIRKRYMKPMKFYLDSLTVLPYEIFCLMFQGEERDEYRSCFAAHRILRAVNIYQYFSGYNFLSNKIIWVRLILDLTYTTVIIHLGACVFYISACPFGHCTSGNWVQTNIENVCGDPYLCSIYAIMSIVSTTAYPKLRVPSSILDMCLFMLIGILSQYLLISLLGDITALLRNSVYNLAQYNFELKEFLTHLENSYVSVPFLEKMKKYCFNLWVVGNGRQIPTLLLEAPNFLIEKIKLETYGKHIYENVVFANCHPDFLRTLIRKLKVQKFFMGDIICHQEDINDTIYFIHKGIVDVYSVTSTEEVHVDTLQELDCFGLIQGLFPKTPHTHTFRANSVATILFLRYDQWSVLLKFFPASKFEIYKNLCSFDESVND